MTIKTQILIIFLFVASRLNAQFKPIIDDFETSWLVKHEVWDSADIDTLYLADTITKDSKLYNKIILNNYDENTLCGFFREDSKSGKAWFWGIYDSTEYLIMDLNLQKQDSFLIKPHGVNKYVDILSIDTINDRKVIELNYDYGGGLIDENIKFIEGVGPNVTFLYQTDLDTDFEINKKFGFLVCKMFKNKEITYAWDTISYECGELWANIETKETKEVFVYPNPTSGLIKIKSSKDITIRIFNNQGCPVICTKDKIVDLTSLPIGIYTVEIKSENGTIEVQKIIVNNAW